MRRKAILVVLAIVLVLGGIGGGIAYAIDNGHQPNYGNKLVGMITLGTSLEPEGTIEFGGHIQITNPDCVNDITLTRLAVLDSAGDVVWEGSPGDLADPLPETLVPHQSVFIPVELDVGPDLEVYTIEIAWNAKKGACPLTGLAVQSLLLLVDDTLEQLAASATPMVNFNQKR